MGLTGLNGGSYVNKFTSRFKGEILGKEGVSFYPYDIPHRF